MPAETHQLNYHTTPRLIRRRAKHPVLCERARVSVWAVALALLIAILMKFGGFKEPQHSDSVAAHMKEEILSADRTKSDSLLVTCRAFR